MTEDEREQAFLRSVFNTECYFAAVRAAGDVPWFEDPDKLAKLEDKCPGISQSPGEDARRILFNRRYQETKR
ncbi:hypothetical protein MMAD_21630 [Mycolicibacterium madagascariense]|uniref:Bacteriophage protein n=1 Tax=Mycolicibacterium madagascariense TaxID=212765 RepID=A0A7I7XFA2_9MYCO|nr:hypothetical protein [Mycolicibacterium madagascariense]MCV7015564.1 hypothetical protein [Mycolicibacterium madagascariense]BBZ27868.1 hypothetical protein MMAD_21630 [Mycolicibacterium madagascariense]